TIALTVAVLVGGGYYFFAKPSSEDIVYVAGEDIIKGETIDEEKVRQMAVHAEGNIQNIDIEHLIGKKATNNIEEGEWLTSSMVTTPPKNDDTEYYTLTLSKTKAGFPFLKEGMEVDVWQDADDTIDSQKILSNILVSKIEEDDEEITVVLALDDEAVSTISTAEEQSGVFFTTGSVTK